MNSKSYSRSFFAFLLSILLIFSQISPARSFVLTLPEQKNFADNANLEKKKFPPANWSRPRKIDVKHLAIDLRFDWKKKQAYGTTAVTFAPFNPADEITLDAAFFTINSIKSRNGADLKFEYAGGDLNDNLKIKLDRIYQPNEEITVKIDYRTNWINQIDPNSLGFVFGKGLKFSEPTANDPLKPREIWSFGDPEANRYWFPGFDAPNDFRATELTATVDRKLTVISNGKLVETKENADGTRAFRWKTETPYANHLTSLAVGEFVDVKQNYDGVELHNFGYRSEKDWIAASTERLPEMMKFFSEKTGAKYPFERYSQIFVQDFGGFAANHSAATITENMVDDRATHADFFYLWDLTEAEALAGQWFGNYLTAHDWRDAWLNKGFAHYLNGLFNEHRNGRAEWLLYVHNFDQSIYLSDWNSNNRHPVVTRNYENAAVFTADNYPSIRGGLVLNLLRRHLGEENWWKVVRHYVKTNAGKSVTTEDFSRAVEDSTGESIGWFFDQWLYRMGHPVFEVTKNYADGKLILNVKQAQKIDKNDEFPQVEFFQGKIDVEIDGRIEQIWLEPKLENVFSFASPQTPKLVNFDFESAWIKEIKFEKSLDELLYQFQKSKDVIARNSAMTELVKIAKNEKTSAETVAKIQNALRQMILSNSYWRLRLGAIVQLQGLLVSKEPFLLDDATVSTLLTVIKNDKSWLRAAAIGFLGMTRAAKFAAVYLDALNDESFRVIHSAAVALGKSKDSRAFDALVKLKDKPSMKSQALISSLAGLKELGDARGFEVAFRALSDLNLPRWRLPTGSVWDFRVFAADTINALGKSAAVFPMIFDRFKKSMAEDDLEGIFYNVVLITKLNDSRGQEAFEMLKTKFKNDENIMAAVNQYETQFKETIKQP